MQKWMLRVVLKNVANTGLEWHFIKSANVKFCGFSSDVSGSFEWSLGYWQ